jgi:hypothetical protein
MKFLNVKEGTERTVASEPTNCQDQKNLLGTGHPSMQLNTLSLPTDKSAQFGRNSGSVAKEVFSVRPAADAAS